MGSRGSGTRYQVYEAERWDFFQVGEEGSQWAGSCGCFQISKETSAQKLGG
ncbi:hypothetical protein RHMOL_Rhmol07G0002500 [Rhododendron molle]|uniref:Uncharacterized protein n=1 Tax=Rhododendron molle TaxID=49168 RepID=A0ACC0MWQ4_RHOML|nr:hypothetical protein RHMOL_Rhmol07G0002500 [Rhododendron molle]